MAGLNILRILDIITPRIAILGAAYPLRAAIRTVHSTRPGLRGLAFWGAVRDILAQPGTPALPPDDQFRYPGDVTGLEIGAQGQIRLTTTSSALTITPLADDLILIRAGVEDGLPAPFSYSVEKPPEQWTAPPVKVEQTDTHITAHLQAFSLHIRRCPCRVTITGADGAPLVEDESGIGQHSTGHLRWQAQLNAETAFYGLGEKPTHLNHAGQRFELWNTDPAGYERGDDPIYMSIPFVMGLCRGQAVGLFFDNSYRSWIGTGASAPGVLDYHSAGGEFRVYVMAGSPARVLERYTELSGRIQLPPVWALGFHQSRWSYFPQARVLEIARQFRERRLPCDVIHLDIHYMNGYRCFTWDREQFPSPGEMIQALHQQGFKALSMIDPGIKVDRGYHVYDQGLARQAFIAYPDGMPFTGPVWPGDCHFPDFTSPEVRRWWGDLYGPLLDDGMDAFWNDMNEIALITRGSHAIWVPDIVRHDREGQGAAHAEIHNVYGLLMARASTEGLRRLRPERRPVILTRSGWAGVQRFAMHWTGDNKSTWDHLRLSVQMVLSLGLSGIALTGPDVGGFSGSPSPELYARWMQVGALLPFYRVHSMISSPDQEPWAFGPEVEAICRTYLELRYRLLHYIYTAAWQASQTGLPLARAMSLMYPDDPGTYNLDDQYLFGDSLLVAPVLDEGAARRGVYLPEGLWYDFWTGEKHSGRQVISATAPLGVLPLYVKGGAAIPLWPVQQYVGEKEIDLLTLHVYAAPGEHHSLLYEDDGVYVDHVALHAHRLSRFIVTDGRELSRVIERGSYAPPYDRLRIVYHGLESAPQSVDVNTGTLLSSAWDAETHRLTVDITAPGAFSIRLA